MTTLSDAVERVRDHLSIYAHHMNPQRLADLTMILASLEARTEATTLALEEHSE